MTREYSYVLKESFSAQVCLIWWVSTDFQDHNPCMDRLIGILEVVAVAVEKDIRRVKIY